MEEVSKLRGGLWALRESSLHVKLILKTFSEQLDGDVRLDRDFRQRNRDFAGHDASEAQADIRTHAGHCVDWLRNAEEGDNVLMAMLEELEAGEKFELLQKDMNVLNGMSASESVVEIERSFGVCNGGGNSSHRKRSGGGDVDEHFNSNCNNNNKIDPTCLGNLLVELSELFQVQEDELSKLQILIECCDLRPAFAVLATNAKQQGLSSNEMIGGSEDLLPYTNLAKKVASSFNPHSEVIRANVLRQGDLVVAILRENKIILMALNTASEHGKGSITTEFLPGTVVAALEEE